MLGESEILSFFVSGANEGELGGGVHPRFSCVTQEIKLTLKTSTSRVVQLIVCGGSVVMAVSFCLGGVGFGKETVFMEVKHLQGYTIQVIQKGTHRCKQ